MNAHPILVGAAVVFGLLFGSFLNVVVYRLPRDIDIFRKRSACPECGVPVPWYLNVPVLSFLVLRGRCGACRARIAARYPLVELATAALFGGAVARWGLEASALSSVVFGCSMLVLALIDYDFQILPNVITLPGAAVGFGLSFFDPRVTPLESLAGALVGGGGLYAVAWLYLKLRDREGMGMGDVKMLLMVGAFLGWKGAFLTIFLGSLAGSLVGVALVSLRGERWEHAMPFGTFLAAGAVIADWVGPQILAWYWGLTGPIV